MDINWEKVVGHKKNISRLQQLIQENRLPHAMLFTGQAGIGKSLIAEILAASLLCNTRNDGVPCGTCTSCRGMANGTHPDFYKYIPMTKNEYEGKTEKSPTAKRILRIEQMRNMQEKASKVAVLSQCSVVIIQGVETMQEAAANAILKTIEEPEGPVFFILLTSHPAYLLDTIRSRCMIMEFGFLSEDEIVSYLIKNNGATEFMAKELAAMADGSIGRAIHLQEERLLELQQEAFKLLKELPQLTLMNIWQQGELFEKWSRNDIKEWLNFLAMLLRDILFLYSDKRKGLYNQAKIADLTMLLNSYSRKKIDAMLKLVLACQYRIDSNVNLRLTMEAFLINLKDIYTGG